jgi:hypothetical protein
MRCSQTATSPSSARSAFRRHGARRRTIHDFAACTGGRRGWSASADHDTDGTVHVELDMVIPHRVLISFSAACWQCQAAAAIFGGSTRQRRAASKSTSALLIQLAASLMPDAGRAQPHRAQHRGSGCQDHHAWPRTRLDGKPLRGSAASTDLPRDAISMAGRFRAPHRQAAQRKGPNRLRRHSHRARGYRTGEPPRGPPARRCPPVPTEAADPSCAP